MAVPAAGLGHSPTLLRLPFPSFLVKIHKFVVPWPLHGDSAAVQIPGPGRPEAAAGSSGLVHHGGPAGSLLVRRGRLPGPGRGAHLGGLGVACRGRTHSVDRFRRLKSRSSQLVEKQRRGLGGHTCPRQSQTGGGTLGQHHERPGRQSSPPERLLKVRVRPTTLWGTEGCSDSGPSECHRSGWWGMGSVEGPPPHDSRTEPPAEGVASHVTEASETRSQLWSPKPGCREGGECPRLRDPHHRPRMP